MNICIITEKYPGAHDPASYAFVKQLVDAIAMKGHNCFVLAPFNITHYRRLSNSREEYTQGEGRVIVYRPGYLSFSDWHLGKISITNYFRKRAIRKAFRMLSIKPDVIYGHFWCSGYDGYDFAKQNNVPLFVASGESNIEKMFQPGADLKEFCDYVSGVICVSSKNRDESIRLGLTNNSKCAVYPNAVNAELFHTRDKFKCRELLGLPKDAFIVAFVGWFNERKGPLRVSDAIGKSGGGVQSLFIGKGDQDPVCEGILFKGFLPHEKVPNYLCASDCFVLPTLHEGCCNAVIEAMACGLPVISSNLPFNWDVLDSTNSIMIDPNNVDEISRAISILRDDIEIRSTLSHGALRKASSLTIDKRAESILNFIQSKTKDSLKKD